MDLGWFQIDFKREDWRSCFLRNGHVKGAGIHVLYGGSTTGWPYVDLDVITSRGGLATGQITMTPDNFAEVCRRFLAEYDKQRGNPVELAMDRVMERVDFFLYDALSADRDLFENDIAGGGMVFRAGKYIFGVVEIDEEVAESTTPR